ncbi:MAG: hypothetical protein ACAI38_01415, partial [Myxococcota bacterium]
MSVSGKPVKRSGVRRNHNARDSPGNRSAKAAVNGCSRPQLCQRGQRARHALLVVFAMRQS